MVLFKEKHATSFSVQAITAGAESYVDSQDNKVKIDKNGSNNSLIITSLATETFRIDLDGSTERTLGILQPLGSVTIKPEDGIFYNFISLTNLSGTDSANDEIKVRMARADPVA